MRTVSALVSAEAGAAQAEAMLLGKAPPVALVLGGAGSGRASLAAKAAAELGWAHLSLEALPRELMEAGHPSGDVAGELLVAGKMLPQPVVLSLFKAAMEVRGAAGYIVDGFPVTSNELAAFEAEVRSPLAVSRHRSPATPRAPRQSRCRCNLWHSRSASS